MKEKSQVFIFLFFSFSLLLFFSFFSFSLFLFMFPLSSPSFLAFGSRIQKKGEDGPERVREMWELAWAKNNSFQRSIKIGIQSVVERRSEAKGKKVGDVKIQLPKKKRKLGKKKRGEGKKKKGMERKKSGTMVERKKTRKSWGFEEQKDLGEDLFSMLSFSSWEFTALRFFSLSFLFPCFLILISFSSHSPQGKVENEGSKIDFYAI